MPVPNPGLITQEVRECGWGGITTSLKNLFTSGIKRMWQNFQRGRECKSLGGRSLKETQGLSRRPNVGSPSAGLP